MPIQPAVEDITLAASGEAANACKQHFEVQPLKPPCKCQNLLWPRRVHALVGLVLTSFLVVHLSISVSGLNPAAYQRNVDYVGGMLSIFRDSFCS